MKTKERTQAVCLIVVALGFASLGDGMTSNRTLPERLGISGVTERPTAGKLRRWILEHRDWVRGRQTSELPAKGTSPVAEELELLDTFGSDIAAEVLRETWSNSEPEPLRLAAMTRP